mmetsp:Transcript_18266/g.37990  ORF Transcript_18266/g.37990 Transcript_18266/m.37990 type:complete len:669 (+) Transcript_18266:95-2101(+)
MKVIVTGGSGFVSTALTLELLKAGQLLNHEDEMEDIERLILFSRSVTSDHFPNDSLINTDTRVELMGGDITDREVLEALLQQDEEGQFISVFHVAALSSGACESNFEMGMNVNLDGTREILEVLRGKQPVARMVNTSTIAVFGPQANNTATDFTKPNPPHTYGVTKACAEALVNEYSRRGFVDGRTARIPTIIVRTGTPSAATTSAFSGVVREPLQGEECVIEISSDLIHPCSSILTCVNAMIKFHDIPLSTVEEKLGWDRAVNFPNDSYCLTQVVEAMKEAAGQLGIKHGPVTYRVDEAKNRIVRSMCGKIDWSRARDLGLPSNPPLAYIIQDFCLSMNLCSSPYLPPIPAKPVVGFVGVGNMGYGMVLNLCKAGYDVIISDVNTSNVEAVIKAAGQAATIRSTNMSEIAKYCDVVLVSLPSENVGSTVLLSPTGLIPLMASSGRKGVLIDTSTVSLTFARACHSAAKAVGLAFLDSPISGGPEGARSGTLTIMVGGSEANFKRCKPVLSAMGRHIALIGPGSAGIAAKLTNNALLAMNAVTGCEGLRLSELLGISKSEDFLTLMELSWGHSLSLKRAGKLIVEHKRSSNTNHGTTTSDALASTILTTTGAPLRNLLKDLSCVSAALTETAPDTANFPMLDLMQKQIKASEEAGLKDVDCMVTTYFR